MEKYSKWRDPGTGIQPFLIPKPVHTLTVRLTSFIGIIFGIVKIPLILLILLLYIVLQPIHHVLVIPRIKRNYVQGLQFCIGLLLLGCFGFYHVPFHIVSLKKTLKKQTKSRIVGSGDVIVSNLISYVDLVLFWTMYAPQFVIPALDGRVKPVSALEAMHYYVFSCSALQSGTMSLSEYSNECKTKDLGPILVFPEGTNSNGRGLLRFLPVFDDSCGQKYKVFVFAIKYTFTNFSPSPNVAYNPYSHIFSLSSQWVNSVSIKQLHSMEVDALVQEHSIKSLNESLRVTIGSLLRSRLTSFSIQDKMEFIKYYLEKERKGK